MRMAKCHPERKHQAHGLCWPCYISKWQKDRYSKEPEYRLRKREHHLKTTYGLSLEDFDNLLKSQDYKCKLCGMSTLDPSNERFRNLHVDHNHKTGRVRGLLCTFCNSKLGWFENRRDLINKYLKESE